jgi:BT4734-like, N-terminal domain
LNTLPSISFGEDIRRPNRLETRNTADVLFGIRDGEWQNAVVRVRSQPADSPAQKKAKLALPYATWSGTFSRRANNGLIRHSGQCGVDLDDLGGAGAIDVLQAAVADVFCLAAFRSARGEGVRLIFRIPPCSPENHAAAFEQVSAHVRKNYGHDADTSGKDVCRASFVSFDNGLWLNAAALVLPIELPDETQRLTRQYRCVSSLYAGTLAETCWTWFGRHHASTTPCQDGTVKTHRNLLDMGKAVALHAHRIKTPLTPKIIEVTFDAWLAEHTRNNVRLRCSPDEYRAEFVTSVKGCERKPWFNAAAEKWLRWTRHGEFPRDAMPHERILFAIRQHCAESKSREFFIGVRDAALIAGVGYVTGWRMLRKLVASGCLKKLDVKRLPRHAETYMLLK